MNNGHTMNNASGSGDQHLFQAGKVMEELARKGVRQHPLANDLCHTVLVVLVESGLCGNVAQVTRLVQKAIDAEVAYMHQRVLWDDIECVKELRAKGIL